MCIADHKASTLRVKGQASTFGVLHDRLKSKTKLVPPENAKRLELAFQPAMKHAKDAGLSPNRTVVVFLSAMSCIDNLPIPPA